MVCWHFFLLGRFFCRCVSPGKPVLNWLITSTTRHMLRFQELVVEKSHRNKLKLNSKLEVDFVEMHQQWFCFVLRYRCFIFWVLQKRKQFVPRFKNKTCLKSRHGLFFDQGFTSTFFSSFFVLMSGADFWANTPFGRRRNLVLELYDLVT